MGKYCCPDFESAMVCNGLQWQEDRVPPETPKSTGNKVNGTAANLHISAGRQGGKKEGTDEEMLTVGEVGYTCTCRNLEN